MKYDHVFSKARARKLRTLVLRWYQEHGRDFPWRNSNCCFHVFTAEILLRQTQAERLVKPYLELIERYPDAQSLAMANVEELRKWFRPLGLFGRANLLVLAARILVDKHRGQVPRYLGELLEIPGMGAYSARAVLCICYGMRLPMVDGGSGRLLQRTLGIIPNGPAYSDRHLSRIAEDILPHKRCKDFNLGLIDIAAIHCRSRNPSCTECPLLDICYLQYNLNNLRSIE